MWRLVWSPVEYFGLMVSGQPRLMVACVPPVLVCIDVLAIDSGRAARLGRDRG